MKLSRVAIALSGLTFLALPCISFAGTSGNLTLSGTVNPNNSLTVTANGTTNTNIDIINGESALNVGSATETSNDAGGYSITLSSTNGGQLELGGTSTTDKTAYQVSYDGGSYVTPTTSASAIKTVNSLSAAVTHTSQILVNVAADSTAVAGNYSDTLTFAIVAP